MWNNFFKHIDIRAENAHILDGNAADLQVECDTFEEKIRAAGGIQLFVGGVNRYSCCLGKSASHLIKMTLKFKMTQRWSIV